LYSLSSPADLLSLKGGGGRSSLAKMTVEALILKPLVVRCSFVSLDAVHQASDNSASSLFY
jgi:hypothetical protein